MAQWMFLYNPNVEVTVSSTPDGIKVSNATQDIGNGTRSAIAQAVVDVMGIPAHEINLDIGHADRPLGPTAGGSQVTVSLYPTTYTAAEKVVEHLLAEGREKLGLREARAASGGIQHRDGFIAWSEVLAVAVPVSITEKRVRSAARLGCG